jgi:hypothetical protein
MVYGSFMANILYLCGPFGRTGFYSGEIAEFEKLLGLKKVQDVLPRMAFIIKGPSNGSRTVACCAGKVNIVFFQDLYQPNMGNTLKVAIRR